jgi:Short C-terminal domain
VFRARRIARRRGSTGKRADTGPSEQAREVQEATPSPDPGGQLRELAELREQGILTEEEFAAEKKKLLGT